MMIRVLQAFVSNDKGGLTAYIVQNYRHIDRSRIQFDFLTYDTEKLDFEEEYISYGAHIFHIHRPSAINSFISDLKCIVKENHYDIVHFHMSYANFIPLLVVKRLTNAKIIMHSHSSSIDDNRYWVRCAKRAVHAMGKELLPYLTDTNLACSDVAGKWMYKNSIIQSGKYYVARNAIEIVKFIFDAGIRKEIRASLGLDDECIVIGHVGRFCYQKNQEFLIEIFKILYRKHNKYRLLFVGDGEEKAKIQALVRDENLENAVLFLGSRQDIQCVYHAMDVFVLPSRFEGLAISGIEAQVAGLPCIVSDTISRELSVTEHVNYVSLSNTPEQWASIVEYSIKESRYDEAQQIADSGYDIGKAINRLEAIYTQMIGRG